MRRSHTVICTAGHIDHGKSSLILGLTGYNPDVLREEQEREMTIDLGFAFYGDEVTFIDVPGHEKFLKTMLAGASGVDGAILVIAADDGIMPQTREHFDVLQLMGIDKGIIALTKVDLAEEDWIELVKDDIHSMTAGTFLEKAPILPLSNRTGAGLDDFKIALDDLISLAVPRPDRGLFRLWLDRAFTIKGSGTVVAGTVLSGGARVGERVEMLPAGIIARIKRIQVHKKDVTSCMIGERAAINLPGVDKESVKRGDLMATPGHYRPTFMLNARLNLLRSTTKAIENRTRLRIHLGSSELIGRVIHLEGRNIEPGDSGLVQFRLEAQAMADIGDRYVIRSFSEGRVLGGGVVLEIHPRKMRLAGEKEIERLNRLESAEPREIIRQFVEKSAEKAADADTIARQTAFRTSDVIDIISALQRDGEVKVIESAPKWIVVNRKRFDELKEAIRQYLDVFHEKNPHLNGVRRSDLKAHLMPKAAQIVIDSLLCELGEEESIVVDGELLRRSDYRITFNEDQLQLKEKIADIYREGRFITPQPDELAIEMDINPATISTIVTALCELGELIKLHGPDAKAHYFHKDAIDEARRLLLKFFETHKEMRFFEFRELIGSTRKYTTPLLMHFDAQGLTYREGDVRKLARQAG